MTKSDGGSSRRGLRVAYLTQWFPPEPVQSPIWIAQALIRQGIHVRVVTGIPNYPSGQVHDGYSARRGVHESYAGIGVTRLPLFPSHSRSSLGRITNYLTFAISSASTWRRWSRSADVCLVYSSPATTATGAIVARILAKTPYVLLVMDVWPDSVFATGFLRNRVLARLAQSVMTRYCNFAYRLAHHVAVTSPGMLDLLISRGVQPGKVSVVYNWADEEVMKPADPNSRLRATLGIPQGFAMMYAGNHGPAQALHVLIEAMAEVRDLPDVHLILVGDGIEKPRLKQQVRDLALGSVHFVDAVKPHELPGLMAAANMQVVSLADTELFRITLPSKVQAILACGEPILACAPGDVAALVDAAGAGLVSPPGDPVALAGAIRRARATPSEQLARMGASGRDFYTQFLSERANATVLGDLLRSAADQ